MVKLTKIYTRGGDSGETSLLGGERVSKSHDRITAFGIVDEANAAIGLVRLHTAGSVDGMLARVQNDLFDLGADIANADPDFEREGDLRITQAQVDRLETEIDRINESLQPLDSFVLPGGTPAAAHLHLARTIVRRAERLMVELSGTEPVNPAAIRYVNRLSDHLFVLSRRLNDNGAKDVLWEPGRHR